MRKIEIRDLLIVKYLLIGGFIGAVIFCVIGAIIYKPSPVTDIPKSEIEIKLQKIAQDTFSNKDVKVTTTPSKFLYEVQVGDTIAYFDASGEYLLVGDLYRVSDLENLTNSRKNEINPNRIITNKPYVPQQAPVTPKNLSWDKLPKEAAITWKTSNKPKYKIAVLSDLNCGYCRQLHNELLQTNDFEIDEYFISILNSKEKSISVYCSKDQVSALHSAFKGEKIISEKCDIEPLNEIEKLAQTNGLLATPSIIAPDGRILQGYHSAQEIRTWLTK
jgi:thiol:disulfide interchange protein DsbC